MGNQVIFDVVMENDIANLDEIVVVGYGTQKKSVVTGAITKVKSADLEDMPVTRIEDALKGRTSGVRVTSNPVSREKEERYVSAERVPSTTANLFMLLTEFP